MAEQKEKKFKKVKKEKTSKAESMKLKKQKAEGKKAKKASKLEKNERQGKVNTVKRSIVTTKLFRKFLIMTGVPVLLVGIVLTVLSVITLNKGLSSKTFESLSAVSATTQATIKTLDSRDYKVDDHGDVYKGEMKMTGNNAIFVNIKNKVKMELTFFYGNTSIASSRLDPDGGDMQYLVGEEADERFVKDVFETGIDKTYDGYVQDGKSTYAICSPIANGNGKVVGMLLITMDQAATKAFIASRLGLMMAVAIVMFVIAALITIVASKTMVEAILINKEVISKLSEGDISTKSDKRLLQIMRRKDEIGDMIRAVDGLQKRLVDVISQMKEVAERLLDNGSVLEEIASKADETANDIGSAVHEVAVGANNQANEVGEAFDRISDMGELISKIVTSVQSLNENAQTMLKAQEVSTANFERLTLTNNNTLRAIEQVGAQIKKTNASVKSINEAVDMISSIADQTTLLSLNASIEAARAGEAGRGFAVVASEIQKLATESNESAQRIKANIEEVVENSASSMKDMEDMQRILDEQITCLDETVAEFKRFAEGVVATSEEARQINEYATQCDVARASTEDNMNALAAISEENASGAEETTASMQTLTSTMTRVADSSSDIEKVAKEVSSSLDFFKI